jgi:Rhodopirellula transposase DDE domain
MGFSPDFEDQLRAVFAEIGPHLDERQRRLLAGAHARGLGHGGIRLVARAFGIQAATVSRGAEELALGALPTGRIRREGAGRKSRAQEQPGLIGALMALIEPDERGDPVSALRWTTKSLRHLAGELNAQGFEVSYSTVATLLAESGFSLQGTAKVLEGVSHPDRDAQFRYLNDQVAEHHGRAQPVISVDSKKKEHIGDFSAAGSELRPKGDPVKVASHTFLGPKVPVAIPYGIYDIAGNTGWVNVGTGRNTAEFAVESIRRWWNAQGTSDYPGATRLLITADGGGSNAYRDRLWKVCLAELALETGLEITVCHLPPGTSKWNKIEHRLFSQITHNWRGRPLTGYEVVISTIEATTTAGGLRVRAQLDTGTYAEGRALHREVVETLPMTRHEFHGEWNYTLKPQPSRPAPVSVPRRREALPAAAAMDLLTDPVLTGMSREQLEDIDRRFTSAWPALAETLYQERFGRPRKHPFQLTHRGNFSTFDRILVTVLYQRGLVTHAMLGDLYQSDRSNVCRLKQETGRLFELFDVHVSPVPGVVPAQDLDKLRAIAEHLSPGAKIQATS